MRASDSSQQTPPPSWRARVQPSAVALPGMTGGAPVNHRSSLRHSSHHSAQTPQNAPQPAHSAVHPPVEETEEGGRIEEFDEYLRAIGADDFIDPISQEPIDPDKLVASRYGHMYDRDSVSEYLQRNPTCPFTRGPLTVNDLFPNFKLKADLVKHRRDFERQKQAPRQESASRPASATVPVPSAQPAVPTVALQDNPGTCTSDDPIAEGRRIRANRPEPRKEPRQAPSQRSTNGRLNGYSYGGELTREEKEEIDKGVRAALEARSSQSGADRGW